MAQEGISLKNLQSLLDGLDKDRLGRKEFENAFAKVVELVLKIQREQQSAISQLQETYKNLLANFEGRHDSTLKDLRKQVDSLFVGEKVEGMSKQHFEKMRKVDEAMNKLEDKMSRIKDGARGERGFPGSPGSPDTPEQIKIKLKTLKIDLDDISKLKEQIERFEKAMSGVSRGGGGKKITYSRSEDLSSQVNGITKAFTLPRKTLRVNAVRISYAPYNLRPMVDWTVTGNTLTLTSEIQTPPLTHTVIADIEVPFYY